MALPSTIQDRDFRNFDDNGDGTTSRYVRDTATLAVLVQILAAIENLSPNYLADQNGNLLIDGEFNVLFGD